MKIRSTKYTIVQRILNHRQVGLYSLGKGQGGSNVKFLLGIKSCYWVGVYVCLGRGWVRAFCRCFKNLWFQNNGFEVSGDILHDKPNEIA